MPKFHLGGEFRNRGNLSYARYAKRRHLTYVGDQSHNYRDNYDTIFMGHCPTHGVWRKSESSVCPQCSPPQA